MANEYLQRTPTSTGNRKVFTISVWSKLSDNSDNNTICDTFSNNITFLSIRIGKAGTQGVLVYQIDNGTDYSRYWNISQRDFSSWSHHLLVFNTTLSSGNDRITYYFNGVKILNFTDTYGTFPQNFQFKIDTSRPFEIFRNADQNVYGKGELFDYFFVDGQALTPEVFGYNKDGRGYISAGSTQATDFRNGQWMPKKPKLIIDEINASGGFGVNGFYLPMNSSNNFGADFHTTPNTILKLKENLPQPKAEIDGSGDYSGDIRDDLGGLPFPGVVKFDGSGDYLSIAATNDTILGNTWTVETWVYFNTLVFKNSILQSGSSVNAAGCLGIYMEGSLGASYIRVRANSLGNDVDSSLEVITSDAWYHIAVTCSNNFVRIFVNGKLEGSGNTNGPVTESIARIGSLTSFPNYDLDGYISNLRVIKGTALYTENFTPPTQPLQKTTDTVLLCCNSKTDATNEETGKTITKYGDVYATTSELTDALVLAIPGVSGGLQNGFGDYSANIRGYGSAKTINSRSSDIATTNSYYGSAIYFTNNAKNDALDTEASQDLVLGTGDFTIEFWVKVVGNGSNSTFQTFFDCRTTDTPSLGFALGATNPDANNLCYPKSYGFPGSVGAVQYSSSFAKDDWVHYAVERVGNTQTFYLNGVAIGVYNNVSSNYTQGGFRLGSSNASVNSGDWNFNGYIQDLRVYKGIAKYKGGFDVPKPYTPVNFSTWRAVPDTSANNFATLNPLIGNYTDSNFFASDGNLSLNVLNNSGYRNYSSTFSPENFKGYLEWRWSSGTPNGQIGITDVTKQDTNLQYTSAGTFFIGQTGDVRNGSTTVKSGCTPSFSSGDTLQIAFDFTGTNKNIWFGRNGTWGDNTVGTGNPSSGTNPMFTSTELTEDYRFYFGINTGAGTQVVNLNFGQNPSFSGTTTAGTNTDSNGKGLFKYAPPSGFLALCEDNLPTPAIADPGKYMKTVLYTGDGSSSRSITGIGFTPDLVWMKIRAGTTQDNQLYDSVRGAGGGKCLATNTTAAEGTVNSFPDSDYGYLSSFDSSGFSINDGAVATTGGYVNYSGRTYTAWCWKAGGAAVSNTDGTITSQVSANQTAGFSIVSYTATGSTGSIGHGLGKTPAFVITKHRNLATHWRIWHKGLSGYNYTLFFTTGGEQVQPAYSALPTDSVINLAGDLTGSYNFVTYSWAEIEGFSKFGSYVGNGSTDGPFVYCGFKPAWIMIKAATDNSPYQAYSSWSIKDSSRYPSNIDNVPTLWANESYEEGKRGQGSTDTYDERFDFLSNGFKIGGPNSYEVETNKSGVTYIFAAFAESPFQYANSK